MKKLLLLTSSALLFLFISCEVKPEKINFGHDACHFCKMTIVDEQHASQFVTQKGKQLKFDAIECALNYLSEHNDNTMAFYLVADYDILGEMTPAKNATYLICKGIKSPMGANLSAFSSKNAAIEKQKELGGKIFDWKEMKVKFDIK